MILNCNSYCVKKGSLKGKKMSNNRFSRTELIFGTKAVEKLANFKVAVFGLGGVGGYVVEALARSGIGKLDLIDSDTVCLSNINRQLYATTNTVGKYKVDIAKQRIFEINPEAEVKTYKVFFDNETSELFDFSKYDYVVDAIDTVTGKIKLIEKATLTKTKIISSMGAGNKIDPTLFEVADIYQTSVCPLAKVMRRELKRREIEELKVVYSKENPIVYNLQQTDDNIVELDASIKRKNHKQTPGSTSFVPPVVGFIIAGEVVKDLIK